MPINSAFDPSSERKVASVNLAQEILPAISQQNIQEITIDGTGQNLNLAVSQTSGFKRWQRSLHLVDGDNQTQADQIQPAEVSDINDDDVSRYLRETLETLAY